LNTKNNGALPLDLACPERLNVQSLANLPYYFHGQEYGFQNTLSHLSPVIPNQYPWGIKRKKRRKMD
jgi:hypothetical protein